MDNKFDPYEGFDPTQESGSACGCSGIYWDMVTQSWRKRATRQVVKPDCSELEEELKKTQADLSSMTTKSEEKQAALDKANVRIAELEKQLAEQPTVCDVLKAHLEPVVRLNDEVVYYAIKDVGCDGYDVTVADLGGEGIHSAAEQ